MMVATPVEKSSSKQAALLALFGCLMLAIDQLSKWLIHTYLPLMMGSAPVYPYGGIAVLPNLFGVELAFVHATNKGAVSGLFSDYQIPLLILRSALILGLFVYLIIKRPPRSMQLPLVMILAGAVGNVIDVLFYGHVVDMVLVRLWGWTYPIFNFADSLICIGVIWLLLLSVGSKSKKAPS